MVITRRTVSAAKFVIIADESRCRNSSTVGSVKHWWKILYAFKAKDAAAEQKILHEVRSFLASLSNIQSVKTAPQRVTACQGFHIAVTTTKT